MYRRFYIQYNSIGTNAIKQVKVVAEKSAEDMDGNGTKVRNDASLEKNDFLGKYGTIVDSGANIPLVR